VLDTAKTAVSSSAATEALRAAAGDAQAEAAKAAAAAAAAAKAASSVTSELTTSLASGAQAAQAAFDASMDALGVSASKQAAALVKSAKEVLPAPVADALAAAAADPQYAGRLAAIALGTPLAALLALRQALYGGYAGDLSPDETLSLLQREDRAKLVDLRSLASRQAAGVPDLRRGARGKGLVAGIEPLAPAIASAVRDARAMEVTRLALRVRGATAARTRVIFMDGGNGDAVAAARALTQLGGRRAFTLRGGFPAYETSQLGVRPRPDYALPPLNAVTEDLVDAAQEAINTTGAVASETLSDPVRVTALAAGALAAGLAVANWELVLEELGVLGIMSSVASRLLSYDSLDELLDDVASTASGAAKAAVSATTTVAGAVGQAASAAASAKAGGAAPAETKEESA